MNLIKSPRINIDLEAVANDLYNFAFTIVDDDKTPINYSGYTSAKMAIKTSDIASTNVIVFTSTGSSYMVNIAGRNTGYFVVSTNSLAIPAGSYLYDFELKNNTPQKVTAIFGKFTVLPDITQ